jgi:aspartate/methionine/tyrosine aminotransferase
LPENFTNEDIEKFKKESGFNPKAIIFSTPSNPTGKILTKQQLELLSELAELKGAVLISDEIYCAFDYDKKHVSAASINPERTITLGGFSKSHAMTGLRVGYMGVSDSLKPVFEKITALQQYSVVCSPAPSQWAAITALEHPLVEEIELMKKRRNKVVEILGGNVEYPYPDGAFYVFPEIPISSTEFVTKAIEKELLVVPGYIFNKNDKTVRISYAQRDDILEEGLNIFVNLVKEIQG